MVGCALTAAQRSADPAIAVHSMHSYFLGVGNPSSDVLFVVRRVREGRSFATRTVYARQNGKTVLIAMVQFHRLEPSHGLQWQPTMPNVPPPESVKDRREVLAQIRARLRETGKNRNMLKLLDKVDEGPVRLEERPCSGFLQGGKPEPVGQTVTECAWMRCPTKLPMDPHVHVSVLAYLSDFDLLNISLKPWGGFFELCKNQNIAMCCSLDHSMWFHVSPEKMRADEWVLFEKTLQKDAAARAFVTGRIWSRSGELWLSFSQELLVRINESRPLQEPARPPEPPVAKL
jgi:acyl-CoA thioesterase II